MQLRGSRAGNGVQSKAHRYLGKVLQKITRRKKYGLLLGVVLVLAGVDDELNELTASARVNHNTWNMKAENRLKMQASFKRMQVRIDGKEGAAGGRGGGPVVHSAVTIHVHRRHYLQAVGRCSYP